MRISILGANGLIARDLCERLLSEGRHELILYTRHPMVVDGWASPVAKSNPAEVLPYADFPSGPAAEAVINFVGIGDPRTATSLGRKVFELTREFDERCLRFVQDHPNCKYLFLSSGAVFGNNFEGPVGATTQAHINCCQPKDTDWYGLAKLYAEIRHRAMPDLSIFDIRVFSYVSRNLDLSAQFFMSDVIRHIAKNEILRTSCEYIVRDYLHPNDFKALIDSLLAAPESNMPLDAYSRGPIGKPELLEELRIRFGLEHIVSSERPLLAANSRAIYYSENRTAERFGYHPSRNSLEGILEEVDAVVNHSRGR